MAYFGLIKKMAKIDAECKKDEELRKRLEPFVLEMNKKKPTNKAEAEKMANQFITKYNEIKDQIEHDIKSEGIRSNSVIKIENVSER